MNLFFSYITRGLLSYFLLCVFGYALSYAQPSWVPSRSAPVVVQSSQPVVEQVKPKTIIKTVEKIKYDTITVTKIDTLIVYDTIKPPKPIFFSYTIYYEILDRKISSGKNFSWNYSNTAQKTILQSSDTTLLSLGLENLRSVGYTYNSNGDRTETVEKIIEGLDMRVYGSSANITYRIENDLLSLNGRFDDFGLLMLTSDFSRRRYLFGLVPLDFLFSSSKYTLFLRIEKTEVK